MRWLNKLLITLHHYRDVIVNDLKKVFDEQKSENYTKPADEGDGYNRMLTVAISDCGELESCSDIR